jgi:serine protease Do
MDLRSSTIVLARRLRSYRWSRGKRYVRMFFYLLLTYTSATYSRTFSQTADFTDLLSYVAPKIVNIRFNELSEESKTETEKQTLNFYRRFGVPLPPESIEDDVPNNNEKRLVKSKNLGSGFIISPDGYILTSAIGINQNSDAIRVILNDGRNFKASIINSDHRIGITLIKIDATNLPAVNIGKSSSIKPGEWVAAIGVTNKNKGYITVGVVSNSARETGSHLPFIQTDLVINENNIGGVLVNMNGEAIGINNSIYSNSSGFQGISFSIPIEEVILMTNALRSGEHLSRQNLGVNLSIIDRRTAKTLGMTDTAGALVLSVRTGSPAKQAGLTPGDVIKSINGKKITAPSDVTRAILELKIGATADLEIWRQDKIIKFYVTFNIKR